ncbi:hypothetical protein [Pasteurella multocida]|uniref:hypothetical protein n=1 Tax=Pasteurella multocida TaxID=747 RepID=UPI00397A0422
MMNGQQQKTLNHNNEVMSKYLKQVQKAINKLDEMGLSVINVHFEKIRPSLRVQPCFNTERLERENKAFVFITGSDGKRYQEAQMTVEGIRVIWRKYLN